MLRIISLNLNYYGDKHGSWNQRKKLIIDVLRKNAPDIVAFQAVAAQADLYGGLDQALQIANALDGFAAHYFQPAQTQAVGQVQGNAVISRLPIVEESHRELTLKEGLDDDSRRIVQRVVFNYQTRTLALYNAHFSWVEEQAMLNAREAVQFTKEGGDPASLLAGDLNTPPGGKPLNLLAASGYTDAWQALYSDQPGYTFESDIPSSRIDYFWASPTLVHDIKRMELLAAPPDAGVRLSDHLGIMLDLED